MNIYTGTWEKVYFSGMNGSKWELEEAHEYFEIGQELTVNLIDVSNWSSSVEFQELPGRWFNTVMFENIKE